MRVLGGRRRSVGAHGFGPHERLRKREEFLRVRGEGRCHRTRHFYVNMVPNGRDHHRLGLVVQKRYWNAVTRNRIKRRLREWFRLSKYDIPRPYCDIVVVAHPGAEKMTTRQIAEEIMVIIAGGDGGDHG